MVVYRSEYGSTQQYAPWLAVDLWCDVFEFSDIRLRDLREYDTIIYGAPLRAGGKVLGSKFLRKEIETLGQKNLILFTCGFSDPTRATNRRIIQDRLIKTLTDEVLSHIKVFHLQGAIDYRELNVLHILMLMRRKRAIARRDPSERTPEDQQLLETYRKSVSFMDRQAVRPIVDYVWRLRSRNADTYTGQSV